MHMRRQPIPLLAICLALLGLSTIGVAQHHDAKPAKRLHSHKKQKLTTLTLRPVHGKGVYHLRVSPAVAKRIAKSKDKTLRVVP